MVMFVIFGFMVYSFIRLKLLQYMCVWMYIYVSKLVTLIKVDPKAPFSIATTPFPGLLHFGMIGPGIEPRSTEHSTH